MRRRSFLLLMPALFLAAPALAAPPDAAKGAPGRVAQVRLGVADAPPKAYLEGRRLLVRREKGEWIALAGIPLSAKARSTLPVEIDYGEGRREVRKLPIVAWKYRTQHLSVPADQAELPAEQFARYQEQRVHFAQVLSTFTEAGPADLALLQPVPGHRSGSFGLRRVINGNARSPHGGLDIAAPEGTPVAAASTGRVVDAGEYLFLGRTIVLDHGQGLLTLCVSVGQLLGAAIVGGIVGSSATELGGYRHALLTLAFACAIALVLSRSLHGRVAAGRTADV